MSIASNEKTETFQLIKEVTRRNGLDNKKNNSNPTFKLFGMKGTIIKYNHN